MRSVRPSAGRIFHTQQSQLHQHRLEHLCCANAPVVWPGFRIEVAPDAQMLCFGSADDVRAWAQRTLEENGSGPLRIVYHLYLGYPVENVTTIHDVLIERGHVQPGRRRERIMLEGNH